MQHFHTPEAPPAKGPYSPAVSAGNLLFASGQIAQTPDGELVTGSATEQTHQIMHNVEAVLGAASCTLANVVHTRILIRDQEMFGEVNQAYGTYFSEDKQPARECSVGFPPIDGADVEISVIAEIPRLARLKNLVKKILYTS